MVISSPALCAVGSVHHVLPVRRREAGGDVRALPLRDHVLQVQHERQVRPGTQPTAQSPHVDKGTHVDHY